MGRNYRTKFSDLVGLTITAIDSGGDDDYSRPTEGPPIDRIPNVGAAEIRFHTKCGRIFSLFHAQDCCESVSVEEIIGDLSDLIDSPILVATENEGDQIDEDYQTVQWTFYDLRTNKGTVTIRWYGSSNGYYSTSVGWCEIT